MAVKISRRRLASYVADQLAGDHKAVVKELAAYLVETKRTKETDLLVRDLETALARHGLVVADVTTAREITADARSDIERYITEIHPKSSVVLREHVEPNLIGGVKVAFSGSELDATVRHKLTTLKTSKIG